MKTKEEDQTPYNVQGSDSESAIIEKALEILERRVYKTKFTSPLFAVDYLRLKYGALDYEVFGYVKLTTRNDVIEVKELSVGKVNASIVDLKRLVEGVVTGPVAAVVLFHHHPSGDCSPSRADRSITAKVQEILKILEITVYDHLVISAKTHYSFATEGLL